jgi:two-component system alkaline phosphatase synthesis response regulator PhoP
MHDITSSAPRIERRILPRPQRVLVVDDSADVRELWSMWLQFWGFAVEQATNGLEAIRKARTFQPHLVLMDLWMPVVDGLTATETLKGDPHMKDVPVLALSADTFSPICDRALEAGADRFLAKPVNPDALLEAIRESLNALIQRSAAQAPPAAIPRN